MFSLNQRHINIQECFHRLAKGDVGMFEAFFEAYKKRVYGVALKMLKSPTEAEEIVQEVFLSIWQSRERLDKINDPEAYLFTATHNAVYTHLKKASRNEQLLNTILRHIARKQNTTEEAIAAREAEQLISKAVQQLPQQQRTVFQLNKQEGLSYLEIAERMHLSPNTVRNHLAESMKTIRIVLKKWIIPVIVGLVWLFK
ncbi:MAG TPA: RNA polymerase sigma-70 factor [Flavitalea sp.]|nr:RNA polymerase sigma-70 factor [Flavitalea sp.]